VAEEELQIPDPVGMTNPTGDQLVLSDLRFFYRY